jgi:predicted nucleotidyltransferase
MKYDIDFSFFEKSNLKWLEDNTIFLCVHGSNAYGTNTPESDIDIRGIVIPPKEYYFGFNNNFEQAQFKDSDITIFGLTKFFQLAANANPNVLELLFVGDDEIIKTSSLAKKLIDNRHLFISKRIRYSMEGYAHAQLKRLKNHYIRFTNPIKERPKREDFKLPKQKEINGEQLRAFESMIKKTLDSWNIGFEGVDDANITRIKNDVSDLMEKIAGASIYINKEDLWKHAAVSLGADSNFIKMIQKEKEYKNKVKEYESYQKWLKTRNKKRAALEEKYKMDVKHASHLYRLYSQCEECLTTGNLTLKDPKRIEMMKDIRNGKWSYNELMSFVEEKSKLIKELYEKSTIPNTPNYKALDKLHEEIVCEFLGIEK